MRKRIVLMLLVLMSLLLLSSCDEIGDIVSGVGNGNGVGGISVSEETRADARIEEIISAIKDKDVDALKSLFSEKALNETDDFNDEADHLFDFIQGDIVSWERDGWASSESIEYGKKSLMIRFGFKLVTDVDEYDLFIIDYNKDTINPDNQGVYMIQLRKSSYEGSWGGSWQERMRAGIFIQEK